MKIESSSIAMAAASTASSERTVRESLRAWVGATRPDFEGNAKPAVTSSTIVELSDAAKAAQSAETQNVSDTAGTVENDPKMQLLRLLIEMLTGKKISVVNAQALSAATATNTPSAAATSAPVATQANRAGFGVEYDRQETYSESASMSFAASGTIRTSDGQDIRFDLSLTMQRNYLEQSSVSVRAGDARKVDPLVINFSGTAAQLSDQAFSFDLNADGTQENIRFVQGGGFLAIDRNGDGQINDGSELFGPASGNGFAELQALDTDGNNWIDENDAAYSQLRLWSKDAGGQDTLASLKQGNVGAIYLGSVNSPFDLKDAQNTLLGQVRASGVWLSEDGQAGSIQQIDLATSPQPVTATAAKTTDVEGTIATIA